MEKYLISIPEMIFSLFELAYDTSVDPACRSFDYLKNEFVLPMVCAVIPLYIIPAILLFLLIRWYLG